MPRNCLKLLKPRSESLFERLMRQDQVLCEPFQLPAQEVLDLQKPSPRPFLARSLQKIPKALTKGVRGVRTYPKQLLRRCLECFCSGICASCTFSFAFTDFFDSSMSSCAARGQPIYFSCRTPTRCVYPGPGETENGRKCPTLGIQKPVQTRPELQPIQTLSCLQQAFASASGAILDRLLMRSYERTSLVACRCEIAVMTACWPGFIPLSQG